MATGIVSSKKATIILLLSAAVHLFYVSSFMIRKYDTYYYYYIIYGLLLLLYPVSDWLAQACLGRYYTIHIGTLCVMVGGVVTVVIQYHDHKLEVVGLSLAALGHTLFEVNAIQFGLDQLQTHSPNNHRAYVYWFYWTVELGHFLYGLGICGTADGVTIVNTAFVSVQVVLSASITAIVVFKKASFYQQPNGTHPLKTILQVLNYTRKNCPYKTRLDFAKLTYRGPFTTEQVENIKTFFYLLLIIFPLSTIYYGGDLPHFTANNGTSYGQCLVSMVPAWTGSSMAIVIIPLYVITPCLYKLTRYIWLLWRLGIGVCISVLGAAATVGLKLVIALEHNNATICSTDVDANLLLIPNLLHNVSYIIVFATALEFICSQAPTTLRGFLIALWYSFKGCGLIIVTLQTHYELECYIGYHIAKAFILSGFLIMYIAMATKYRYRTRSDTLCYTRNNYQEILKDESCETDISNDTSVTVNHNFLW